MHSSLRLSNLGKTSRIETEKVNFSDIVQKGGRFAIRIFP